MKSVNITLQMKCYQNIWSQDYTQIVIKNIDDTLNWWINRILVVKAKYISLLDTDITLTCFYKKTAKGQILFWKYFCQSYITVCHFQKEETIIQTGGGNVELNADGGRSIRLLKFCWQGSNWSKV